MTNHKHPFIKALYGLRLSEGIVLNTIKNYIKSEIQSRKKYALNVEIRKHSGSNFLEPPRGDLMWECADSPIGVCIYDVLDDPARDHCIFCGQPEERK